MATHCSTFAWKIPWQRSLEGCSPWGRWGSDTTERLHFHFSLSYIGEGNGNPLQCSCLERPRDGGAWWVAIYGVAQSQTRLKWLSSSYHGFSFLVILCNFIHKWQIFPNKHSIKERDYENIISTYIKADKQWNDWKSKGWRGSYKTCAWNLSL